jgi:hypothetical protein
VINVTSLLREHFGALTKLSIAVAQGMPAEKYGFRPLPDSMTFGDLMSHIAMTTINSVRA